VIKSESVEKIMRVQLVADGAVEAIEKMRPEEPDLEQLNYSAPQDNVDSFSQGSGFSPEADGLVQEPVSTKRRMVAGPPRGDDRPMNRANRRKGR
jgi:hypothetical protein